MLKKLRAQRENDASADFRGEVRLGQPERAVKDGENTHQHSEVNDESGVSLEYSIIDDGAIDKRTRDADGSVEDDNEEKYGKEPNVRRGKAQGARHRTWSYCLVHDRGVLSKGAQRRNSRPRHVMPPIPGWAYPRPASKEKSSRDAAASRPRQS